MAVHTFLSFWDFVPIRINVPVGPSAASTVPSVLESHLIQLADPRGCYEDS